MSPEEFVSSFWSPEQGKKKKNQPFSFSLTLGETQLLLKQSKKLQGQTRSNSPSLWEFLQSIESSGKDCELREVWRSWTCPPPLEDASIPWDWWGRTQNNTNLHVLFVRVCTGVCVMGGRGGITVTGIAVRGIPRKKPFSNFFYL